MLKRNHFRFKKVLPLFALLLLLPILSVTVSAAYGPEAEPAPSGAYLKYTVTFKKPEDAAALAYSYEVLKKLDYTIEEGDMLEYDVRCDTERDGLGAVDGRINGITIEIRGIPGIADQNGLIGHTLADLSEYCYDQWYHRVLNIAITEEEADVIPDGKVTVGKKFTEIQLGVHPMGTEEFDFTAVMLYDNIVITNNGVVKYVIFQEADDLVLSDIKHLHGNGYTTSKVELLEFTPEQIESFTEEAASRELASIAASEEASRQKESQDKAREEASVKASEEQASRDAASREAAEAAEAGNADEGGGGMWLVIACVGGVVLIVIAVVVIFVVTGSKKKSK